MGPKTHGKFLILGTNRIHRVCVEVSDQDNSSLDEPDHTNIMWKDITHWKEYRVNGDSLSDIL